MPVLFAQRWSSVLEEYAVRYGSKVSGWWIDGCYGNAFNYTDAKLQYYSNAIKAGNPHAIVAFNSDGLPVTPTRKACAGPLSRAVTDCNSRFETFTCGESNAANSFADRPEGYGTICTVRHHLYSTAPYHRHLANTREDPR